MTSIEILEKIIKHNEEIYRFGSSSIVLTNDEWNEIYKELKVLEILKDRLYFDYQFNVEDRVYHKIVMKFISFTDDDYEKVKEWLENGI